MLYFFFIQGIMKGLCLDGMGIWNGKEKKIYVISLSTGKMRRKKKKIGSHCWNQRNHHWYIYIYIYTHIFSESAWIFKYIYNQIQFLKFLNESIGGRWTCNCWRFNLMWWACNERTHLLCRAGPVHITIWGEIEWAVRVSTVKEKVNKGVIQYIAGSV